MTIHETIKNQIKEALRAKDTIRLDTLRGLNALFMNEMLNQKATESANSEFLPDEKVLALIKRSVKQRLDSIRQFEIGKRPDLAEKEKAELRILESFLPAAMTIEQIEIIARKVVEEQKKHGAVDQKSIGKLTGLVMKELAGKANGNDVKIVLEGLLK